MSRVRQLVLLAVSAALMAPAFAVPAPCAMQADSDPADHHVQAGDAHAHHAMMASPHSDTPAVLDDHAASHAGDCGGCDDCTAHCAATSLPLISLQRVALGVATLPASMLRPAVDSPQPAPPPTVLLRPPIRSR